MSSGVFTSSPRNGQRSLRSPGFGNRDNQTRREEELRQAMVVKNRHYYEGTQYDEDNEAERLELNLRPDVRLPEHRRLHAYSTQIAEAVDFIACQLTNGFQIIADDEKVQDLIDAAIDATDALHNDSDEEIAVEDLMIDGAKAGDTPYMTLWDPVEGTAYWEFWDACQVEFDVPRGRWVKKVTRKQTIWVDDFDSAGTPMEREVEETVIYDLAYPPAPIEELPTTPDGVGMATPDFVSVKECRARTFWDGEPEPRETDWLGLPFIPWGVLRVDKRGLKGYRGDPLITRKALDAADRYNANEQTAYLIARYNSHGNLAVVGDQAFIKLELDPVIGKDIADVIRLPGGTAVTAITLPTDPTMIEHTKQVTADAMYASFGLVRVEPDTLGGLGGVSGYALEILNRKSEGTFKRIRRTFKTDFSAMINQCLDVTAYRQGATLEDFLIGYFEDDPELDVPTGLLKDVPFWEIDPQVVFPNRDIEIRMGTGYIVDSVKIRDDFNAKLISQEEALRELGFGDEAIEDIIEEQRASAQEAMERTMLGAGLNPDGTPTILPMGQDGQPAVKPNVVPAGSSVKAEQKKTTDQKKPVPTGTQAGKTTGATNRR